MKTIQAKREKIVKAISYKEQKPVITLRGGRMVATVEEEVGIQT